MADFSKRFNEIIKDIESNIKDEKEREYINKKIAEISLLNMEIVEEMINTFKSKIESIEKTQKSIESKVDRIGASVTGIESDIYDDGFEFEIICPYCNTEFIADVESKSEIKCPECNNTIELDWNGGEELGQCSGHCSMCNSKCGENFLNEFGEDVNIIDDDDDDM